MTVKAKFAAAAVAALMATPTLAASPVAEPIVEPVVAAPLLDVAPIAVAAPVAAAKTWTGFYAGGSIGGMSQDGFDAEDNTYGLHLGYNRDLGNYVIGAEVGYGLNKVELDDKTGDMERSLSLKAKAGYDMGEFLPYVTAGVSQLELDGATTLKDKAFVYGVGFDYKLSDNVFVGGEVTQLKADDFDGSSVDLEQTNVALKVSYGF